MHKGKVYEAPPPAAYEPHTVYLLEARYLTQHGVGRQDSTEYVVGVCREGDLPAIIDKYNSTHCPKEEMEIMDNAVWPWMTKRQKKMVVWWDKGETRSEIMERRQQEIYGDALPAGTSAKPAVPVDLAFAPVPPAVAHKQRRAFHSSVPPRSDTEKTTTTAAERAEIPASSWSRPHKPSQDADDNVVPTYYIERRRQLDDIAERKEEEGGLMAELSAGILSEGIAAQTRPREEKIPPEVIEEDGTVRLPSGFEPPTAATDFHPVAALQPLDTDDPVVKSGTVEWEEALAPEGEGLAAGVGSFAHGVRGFHTSAVARAREVPLHSLDSHAAPPQPPARASDSRAPAARQQAQKQKEYELVEKEDHEDSEEYLFEGDDVVEEVGTAVPPVADSVRDFNDKLQQHRNQYMATLQEKPFWRPVLTATLSTRSLALTYARLSRALPRGLPYYASIEEHDRKYAPTFNSRMHNLRVRRMRQLVVDIGRRLRGDFGGFPGLRFGPSDRGRTIDGEGLEAPIPADKRVIHVGVGEWHRDGQSLREILKEEIGELDLGEGFNIFGLDERGKRSDGVEWSHPQAPVTTKKLSDMLGAEYRNLAPHLRKKKLEEIAEEKGRQIAFALSQRNRRVDYPPQARVSLDTFDDDDIPPAVKPESVRD